MVRIFLTASLCFSLTVFAEEHVVQKGESLMTISFKHYGTHQCFRQILHANKQSLPSMDKLERGQRLTIPPRSTCSKAKGVKPKRRLAIEKKTRPPLRPKKLRPTCVGACYTLQVAAYQNEPEAMMHAQSLKEQGVTSAVRKADLGTKGVWYRVYAGRFGAENLARKSARRYQNNGLIEDYLITSLEVRKPARRKPLLIRRSRGKPITEATVLKKLNQNALERFAQLKPSM